MELYHHPNPLFTKWVVAEGLLQEPFVVIDVGCQGGEHARWAYLGRHLELHGFDPIPEVIEALRRENAGRPNRHYHEIGLGNEDGRRLFHVQPDTYSSSFLGAPEATSGQSAQIALGSREVAIRKLDSLHAEKAIPPADHIKLDCEGFEPEILIGARQYMQDSGVLSAMVETSFNASPLFPQTHFYAVLAETLKHRLMVADYSFDRVARPSYTQALAQQPWPEPAAHSEKPPFLPGAPATHNFLFCRDFTSELASPEDYAPDSGVPLTADRVIKAMITFELHGLMDRAYAHAETFAHLLGGRLDVDKAKQLLLAPPGELRYNPDLVSCLQMIDRLRLLLHACESREPPLLERLQSRWQSILGRFR